MYSWAVFQISRCDTYKESNMEKKKSVKSLLIFFCFNFKHTRCCGGKWAVSGINNRNTRKKKLYAHEQENRIKDEIPFAMKS